MAIDETEVGAVAARTPRSARLPHFNLESAVGLARALHDLAGPSSTARIAEALGSPMTSARFQSRLAAAQYFGLITKGTDGKFAPTARAIAVLEGNDDERIRALRHAVLATGAGKLLVERLSGRAATEQLLRTRLEEDLGVPTGPAETVAKVILESAQFAQLIKTDRFDAVAIEEAWDSLPKESEQPAVRRDGQNKPRKPEASKPTAKKTAESMPATPARSGRGANSGAAPPLAAPFNLSISLNVSHLSVDQIVDLVSKLATSAKPS